MKWNILEHYVSDNVKVRIELIILLVWHVGPFTWVGGHVLMAAFHKYLKCLTRCTEQPERKLHHLRIVRVNLYRYCLVCMSDRDVQQQTQGRTDSKR